MAWRWTHLAAGFCGFVVNLAFFVLYVATANYTRLLLDELRKLGMDATHRTPPVATPPRRRRRRRTSGASP